MTQYVVIGTSPSVETTVAVGPFRSLDKASDAWDEMTARGFVAETVTLERIEDVEPSPAWDGGEGEE